MELFKVIITGPKIEGTIVIELDAEGTLRKLSNDADLNDRQKEWLSNNFPMTLEKINEMVAAGYIKAKVIECQISFESFWEKYNYKLGKKEAKRFWDKLTEGDQIVAFMNIDPYDFYLIKNPQIQKLYPASYLNPHNRKFENDYKALVKR